jgi:hypothetical protein
MVVSKKLGLPLDVITGFLLGVLGSYFWLTYALDQNWHKVALQSYGKIGYWIVLGLPIVPFAVVNLRLLRTQEGLDRTSRVFVSIVLASVSCVTGIIGPLSICIILSLESCI